MSRLIDVDHRARGQRGLQLFIAGQQSIARLADDLDQRTERVRTGGGKILAQLLFCEGCCCGRTDRGFSAFPRDWIKSLWKQTKLNRHIQLTISGCLGPCDVANVACICVATAQRCGSAI